MLKLKPFLFNPTSATVRGISGGGSVDVDDQPTKNQLVKRPVHPKCCQRTSKRSTNLIHNTPVKTLKDSKGNIHDLHFGCFSNILMDILVMKKEKDAEVTHIIWD